MVNEQKQFLEFGRFRIDLVQKVLLSSGEPISLAPKAFDTLLVLVEAGGRIVEKDELLKRVWPDTFVEEGSLARNVSTLRKVLGESPDDQKYIQTVPRRGYRFVAPVTSAHVEIPRLDVPEAPSFRAPGRSLLVGLVLAAVVSLAWASLRERSVGPPIHSIAVMPFANLSAEPDFLADGVTDAVITSLGQLHSVQVFSRSATLRFRGNTKTPQEAGADLRADAILEGTVQKSGSRARVSAHLVRSATGTALWSRDYVFDIADILKLESEVARTVASGIRVELTPEESRRLSGRSRKIDPHAQQLFLEATDLMEHRSPEPLKRAQEVLERAIEIQPDFAEAWANLSHCLMEAGIWGGAGFRPMEAPARKAAIRAIELDPTLAEGHAAMGQLLVFYDLAWESSEHEFRRAVELNPNAVESHRIYGGLLTSEGRHAEALAHLKTAWDLDPASSTMESEYARGLYRARRYSEAISHFQHAQALDPHSPEVFTRAADAYEMLGQNEKAIEAIKTASRMRGQDPDHSGRIAAAYAIATRREDALRVLRVVDNSDTIASPSYDLALAYFHLGDRERGFGVLTKFMDSRGIVMYLNSEPRFDIVRDDPRFQALVARLGLPSQRK